MAAVGEDRSLAAAVARLRHFHRDPLSFFQTLTGDFQRVKFHMGLWDFYLLNEPESVRFVLTHHLPSFIKGPGIDASNPLIGQGMATQEGDTWIEHRRRMGPVFKPDSVKKMVPWLEGTLDLFGDRLATNSEVDLEASMMELAMSMALRTLFGVDNPDPEMMTILGEHVRWIMAHFYARSRSPWRFPYQVPVFNRRYHARAREVKNLVHSLKPGIRPFDTLWQRLSADSLVRDHELIFLIVAGYETTSHTMASALDLLSRSPDALKHVYEESGQSGLPEPLTHPWTEAVVQESLRLHPPVWLLSRRPRVAMEYDGWSWSARDVILISPWLLHHTEEWFRDAERFRPERWIDQPAPIPYTYIPFGAGPRACIGEHLALQEAILAVSRLTARFIFETYGPRGVYPDLTLKARYPLWAHVQRR